MSFPDRESFLAFQPGVPTLGEVVELMLLLPTRQAVALEQLAWSRGVTLGALLRALVRDTLGQRALDQPGNEP